MVSSEDDQPPARSTCVETTHIDIRGYGLALLVKNRYSILIFSLDGRIFRHHLDHDLLRRRWESRLADRLDELAHRHLSALFRLK